MSPQDAVQQLIAAGWSEAKIAAAVSTSQPTIHRVKHGLTVRRGVNFEVGSALIALAGKLERRPDADKGETTDAEAA